MVPALEVLDHLKGNRYRLGVPPKAPPVELLDHLISRLKAPREVGPKIWTEPRYAQKLAPLLLKDDRRASIVDGYPIIWLEDEPSFRNWARRRLLDLDAEQIDVISRLANIKDVYAHRTETEIITDHDLSPEVQEHSGLVFIRNQQPSIYNWTKLELDEYQFVQRLINS